MLELPVSNVKFVGSTTVSHLRKLGIESVGDLLFHFPHRYLDLSKMRKISELRAGDHVTIVGNVTQVKKWRAKTGMRVVNVTIGDGTGNITGTWFNQDYIAQRLKEGMQVTFSGKVAYKYRQLQLENPLYDILNEKAGESIHSGRIVSIHPATQNLSTTMIRRIMKNALDAYGTIDDPLPTVIIEENDLLPKAVALREIHFPSNRELLFKARARFIFEELFVMQVALAARKKHIELYSNGIQHKAGGELVDRFYDSLSFELTVGQKKVIAEIQEDMSRPTPMNRLLQGEVGCGKTMVAIATLLTAVQSGYQGAMMAPTEVLATQHYLKIKDTLESLGVTVALLKGTTTPKEREKLLNDIKAGDIDIVIGTHAIIQATVDFNLLGVAVIDEQHRFGVEQRITLKEKGYYPDVLIMSATPIPRTLSLTLYGDLDVSIIKELPCGRIVGEQIKTVLCQDDKRGRAYEKIRSEVQAGRQAYIVCPLIEESDKLEVKAVLEEAVRLKNEIFPDLRVGLIHGKLKSAEKEAAMAAFDAGELDVLISTTVIEVGIDVPNATVMLIEDADRFGLAQLHQLRGRVGRGRHKSWCILFASMKTDDAKQRMKAICEINDGFRLAEADLQIRGEGQLFGTRQSGMPELRIARLTRDIEILVHARKQAFTIIENDPRLSSSKHAPLRREIMQAFGSTVDWLFQA
ncbi:MAG TPA: ATP-dependent DNA helicase RecG [Candidatus Aquicultor sp.]|jgi:ATP-dependent DNA helicase RecG